MDITPAVIQYFFQHGNQKFNDGWNTEQQIWYPEIATEVTSSTEEEIYAWGGLFPQLREWIGDRVYQSLGTYGLRVRNRPFEATVVLPANKIRDDQFNMFGPALASMGMQARKWPDTLMAQTLQNGQNLPSYDGVNFFSTSHPIAPYSGQYKAGTQRNYWSSGMALTPDNFQTVRNAMVGYRNETGIPLYTKPTLLVVPPQLSWMANIIANAGSTAFSTVAGQTAVGAVPNMQMGVVKVLEVPELQNDPTSWYVLDTSRGIKPFIFQNRSAPNFIQLTGSTDEPVWKRNEYVYGVDVRGNTFAGLWFMAAKASA